MSEAMFFPKNSEKLQNLDVWKQLVNSEFSKMENFLLSHVGDGGVKEKLYDQLIWLRYQINYFQTSHNLELLEENFNWVVSNFNHDLSLTSQRQFKPIQALQSRS